MDQFSKYLDQFSKYLENKFSDDLTVLFILDLNESLVDLKDLLDNSLELSIFGKKFKLKSFSTKDIDDYYTFIEKEIRNFKNKKLFLIILSHNSKESEVIPYLEIFKEKSYLEFDIEDFIKTQFKISFNRNVLIHYKINWFINRSIEILAYRTKYQKIYSTGILFIQDDELSQFFEFCKEFRHSNLLDGKPERPLFVVDMTLYEFIKVLEFVHNTNQEFNNETPNPKLLKKKRKIVKDKIYDMFGKVPMDFEKGSRNLPNPNTKAKMAGNFMITINQLKLLEDINTAEELHNLYMNNQVSFFKKLKKILLIVGKWNEYLEAIEKANEKNNFNSSKTYKQYISKYLQMKYYRHYPVKTERWRRQLNYILKWLTDERLKICKKSQDGFKILIISEEEEKSRSLKNVKIYKHVFDSEKKSWIRKSL